MQFRSRYTGEFKLTNPETGIGQSWPLRQTEIFDLPEKVVEMFKDSLARHVKAGLLVPLDTAAKEMFKLKK